MPQPLKNVPQINNMELNDSVFQARPRHIEVAVRIMSAAAFSDQWLGNILVGLDPKNATRLAKVFNEHENDAKRSASFRTAATTLLDEGQQDLLDRIARKHRSTMKLRHPFAHHRYGYTPDDANYFLLIDPRKELLARAGHAELAVEYADKPELNAEYAKKRGEVSDKLNSDIMVYTFDEMVQIVNDIQQATRCFTAFWNLTSMNPPPHVRADIEAQLNRDLTD